MEDQNKEKQMLAEFIQSLPVLGSLVQGTELSGPSGR